MKNFLILFVSLAILAALPPAARANVSHLDRIRRAQALVADHDPRTAQDIYEELRSTPAFEANLRIYEAVAATYRDLTAAGKFTGQEDSKKLYDRIRMNVAFIQFGGNPSARDPNKINMWIRQTLMKYLPDDLVRNKKVFYSSDEWRRK